jgi:hypothetical protein
MTVLHTIVKVASVVIACSIGATLSFAGHYVAGTSSGLSASASPGSVTGPTYSNGSATVSFGGGAGGGSISGIITTTFSWVPAYTGEPAPESVIIIESCTIGATVNVFNGSSGTGSASANNGLNPVFCENKSGSKPIVAGVPGGSVPIGTNYYANSSGTAARIVAGGNTISVTCSPSASCSGNGPFSGSANYSAIAYPIQISMSGHIIHENRPQTIVGKRITVQLSTGGDVIIKPTTLSWSVSGDVFDHFYVSQDQSSGYKVELNIPQGTLSPKFAYFDAGTSEIAASAEIAYRNISIGTANAKCQLMIIKPSSSLIFQSDCDPFTDQSGIYSSADPYVGISWYYWVIVPSRFLVGSDVGSHSVVQLVSVNRVQGTDIPESPIVSVVTNRSLDNVFPYDGWSPATVQGMGLSTYEDNDTPSAGFTSHTKNIEIQDQFFDTLLF